MGGFSSKKILEKLGLIPKTLCETFFTSKHIRFVLPAEGTQMAC